MFRKPKRITETYKGEKALRRGVQHMSRRGYRPEEIVTKDGRYRAGKAFMLGAGGTLLFGPIGAFAALLAGHKKEKFTVIYVREDQAPD